MIKSKQMNQKSRQDSRQKIKQMTISKKFSSYIDELKKTASTSELFQCHAAMLLKGNRVINISRNENNSCCCGVHGLPSMHAEAGVIRSLYGRRRRFKCA